jgi:transposase
MEPRKTGRWASVDWGNERHAVCVLDEHGKEVDAFETPHTAEGLAEMAARLHRCGPIGGVAVETTRSLMVQKLLEAGWMVYPINPKLSHAWREGWKVTAPKSDRTDAWVLAEGLRQHRARLRPLQPDDPRTRELRMLCGDECRLIAHRTALVNQLQATLREYYPQALDWFEDWAKPTSWDFVLAFSTAEALARAGRKKLYGFLKSHCIGLHPIWQERVEGRSKGPAWPSDPATVEAKGFLAVALAKELRTLQASLDLYRERIEKLYGDQPDSSLFNSLPAAGPKIGPRLLTHFGADRARFDSAEALEQLSGAVPVTDQSGRSKRVHMRRQCQKEFRTTLHLWSFLTLERSVWARAFYDRCRRAGQSHALALRNLARKWLRILYRMWQERRPYDEGRYLAALIRRRSPLVQEIASIQPLTTGA